jgi:hypothetical protein
MADIVQFPRPRDLAIMLVPLAVLLVSCLVMGAGLTYTLDDPYIHLALARRILGGHYGINVGEWSSPSSSILWPFMLAPFAALSNFEHVPLLINAACAVMSVVLLYDYLARLLGTSAFLAFAVVAVALGLNLYGLVFTGMEHSLQVLLVIVLTSRLCRDKMDQWFWLAVVLLPLIRYEGLAISLPVCVYAWHKGHRRAASWAAVAILLVCGAFSFFLLRVGLAFLPSSVIAKGDFGGLGAVWRNAVTNTMAQPVLLIFAISLPVHLYRIGRHAEANLVLSSAVLFYGFGKCGWFGRYEVFYVAFVVMLCLNWWLRAWQQHALKGSRSRWILLPALLVAVMFPSLPRATITTPLAAVNIRDQQMQMGEIVRRLREPVAVNDLGVVSLRSDHYVLDLWGLGSFEALHLRRSDPSNGWIGDLMARKGVEVALVYDYWIKPRPAHWIRVGKLVLPGRRITPAEDTVSLYATNEMAATRFRAVLASYRESSPLARSITRIF